MLERITLLNSIVWLTQELTFVNKEQMNGYTNKVTNEKETRKLQPEKRSN